MLCMAVLVITGIVLSSGLSEGGGVALFSGIFALYAWGFAVYVLFFAVLCGAIYCILLHLEKQSNLLAELCLHSKRSARSLSRLAPAKNTERTREPEGSK